MREHPILFNGAMVRAILAGQKTQTRRAVAGVRGDNCLTMRKPTKTKAGIVTHVLDAAERGLCPFGKPGDRLWVRETWAQHPDHPDARRAVYRAAPGAEYDSEHWRPSIHMPRWACRLVLEITAVRVERLHAISEADAIAEGAPAITEASELRWQHYVPHAQGFINLWNSTGGDWDSNPWVWVIDFRVVTDGVSQHPPSVSPAGGCPPGPSRPSQRLPEQHGTTRSPASQSGQSAPHTDRPKAGAIA